MAIQFSCSQCNQPIEVDDAYAGQAAACPYCRHVVTVPQQSTFRADTTIAARPASSDAPLPLGVPALRPVPAQPERIRRAASFGNYALVCTALTLGLLLVAVVVGVSVMVQETGLAVSTQPSVDEVQAMQTKMLGHPVFLGTMMGTMFFAVVGVVLAVVSLAQSARGNWRGIVAVVVCGSFLLCQCGGALVQLFAGTM